MSDTDIETLVTFFKALADATRLRIVGLLAVRPRTVEELATLTEVRPPTISHHLARLKALGLVQVDHEGTTRHYSLQTQTLEALSRQTLSAQTWTRLGTDVADELAWPRKILRDFIVDGRLQTIPASRKKREVILEWLADQFAPDQTYSGPEVNALIQAIHPDSATLRRELIGAKWLTRDDYGHAYQRNPARVPRAFD
jgi:DNA-binding transcriptional ArsR family regulator